MIESIDTQSLLKLLSFDETPSSTAKSQTTLPKTALENLALTAEDASTAAGSSGLNGKVTLSVQSLVNLITNAVLKAVTTVVSLFLGKMGNSAETTPSGTTTGTQGSGSTASTETEGTDTDSTTEETSTTDTLKNFFKKIQDFFGGTDGIGGIITDIITTIIPGAAGAKILKKFKSIGKAIGNLLNMKDFSFSKLISDGGSLLKDIFSGGKDLFKGVVNSGKKLLKKIF
jgi:hypothetical protein